MSTLLPTEYYCSLKSSQKFHQHRIKTPKKKRKRNKNNNKLHVYLRSSLLRKSFVIFMFISLKFLVSKSSNCDLVIFNHIASLVLNLFCSESKTWLNDASPSQFTWIVLLYASCGAHEQGEISGLMEQWSEATCTIETSVYTNDPIFKYYLVDIQISNQYPFYRLKNYARWFVFPCVRGNCLQLFVNRELLSLLCWAKYILEKLCLLVQSK